MPRTRAQTRAMILALQLSIAPCLWGQMAGMAKPDTAALPVTRASNLTFSRDVAPILQQHCQSCHRPGEGTPFSMLTYEDARPWASMMKKMVVTRAMPPWFEDGHTEKFENNRSLTQAQIDTIAGWVDAGAPKGDPKDLPPPIDFVKGWTIPKPDKIYQLPRAFSVPATGILDYQYVIVPTGFTKDTWVQDVEAAPTDRSVVHHIVAYVRTPGSNYFKDQPKEEFFVAPPAKTDEKAAKDDVPNDWLVGYAPGQPPDIFAPGQAKLIPAGSDIVLEVHYMPEGKATTDQANVGLVLAKEPPTERVMTLSTGNEKFKIPPGDPNYRVDASFTFRREVTLLGMHPHMHMRGKDMSYRLVFPDGTTRSILNVPHYNWRWQLWYNLAEPIKLPAGTRVECTAHYDNSAGNPENPDPSKTVTLGPAELRRDDGLLFQRSFPRGYTVERAASAPVDRSGCAYSLMNRMMNRRTFVKAAAAGVAASALPAYALAPLTIGIGTFSYHALSFDDMMAQLEILLPTNGLHNQQIEMSRGEYMILSHPNEALFQSARAKLDKAGIKCASYYAATLKNEQEVAQAVAFAKLLGAHNITGDATGADLLKHIDRSVSDAGLTFSIHNHFFAGQKFPYESPDDVLNALAGLSANCGATADTGHFAACGYDPVDAVRKLAPRLNLVHLKDVKAKGSGENVLLGSGIAKIPEVEAELHRQNFRRLVAIEYEKEGNDDVRDDMRTNVAYAWQYGFSGA